MGTNEEEEALLRGVTLRPREIRNVCNKNKVTEFAKLRTECGCVSVSVYVCQEPHPNITDFFCLALRGVCLS